MEPRTGNGVFASIAKGACRAAVMKEMSMRDRVPGFPDSALKQEAPDDAGAQVRQRSGDQ
jgi:hypothetical protein